MVAILIYKLLAWCCWIGVLNWPNSCITIRGFGPRMKIKWPWFF